VQQYAWTFTQNGVLIWDSARDDDVPGVSGYGIHPEGVAHTKFVPGAVEVRVKELVSGQWTDETLITIFLQ
jgi:hypothetical protein